MSKWICVLTPTEKTTTTRPVASARRLPATTNESSKADRNIDYTPCFSQQTNSARLQRQLRSMMTEMMGLQEQQSKEIRKWENKWHQWCDKNRNDLAPYEYLCDVFMAAATSVGLSLAENKDDLVQRLETILDRIPENNEQQSLKEQLRGAHSDVDRLTKELNLLNKELNSLKTAQRNLEEQQHGHNSGSPLDKLKRKERQISPEELHKQLNQSRKSIKSKQLTLDESKATYREDAADYFDRSQQNELRRLELMKKQLNNFVDSFVEDCTEFNEVLDNFDPKTELREWKHRILHHNVEENESHNKKRLMRQQSGKTPSPENETYISRQLSRQQSVKNQSPESATCDINEMTCQQAVETRLSQNKTPSSGKLTSQRSDTTRTNEDKTRDSKHFSRQQSVKSGRHENETRDNKTTTNQASPLVSPADNDS